MTFSWNSCLLASWSVLVYHQSITFEMTFIATLCQREVSVRVAMWRSIESQWVVLNLDVFLLTHFLSSLKTSSIDGPSSRKPRKQQEVLAMHSDLYFHSTRCNNTTRALHMSSTWGVNCTVVVSMNPICICYSQAGESTVPFELPDSSKEQMSCISESGMLISWRKHFRRRRCNT